MGKRKAKIVELKEKLTYSHHENSELGMPVLGLADGEIVVEVYRLTGSFDPRKHDYRNSRGSRKIDGWYFCRKGNPPFLVVHDKLVKPSYREPTKVLIVYAKPTILKTTRPLKRS